MLFIRSDVIQCLKHAMDFWFLAKNEAAVLADSSVQHEYIEGAIGKTMLSGPSGLSE